jgi:energy-converting hydrogenase Eha subunit H
MASPRPARKSAVDLGAPAARVSRIRRDPPPKVKEISAAELKERQALAIVLGVTLFAFALFIALVGISKATGWSLSEYRIELREDG